MTKAIDSHRSKLAEFGCIACWLDSGVTGTPAEIHHPRAGTGLGLKASDFDAIPLCPRHHRGTDHPATPSIHMAKRAFIDKYGTEADLLETLRAEM